MKSLISTLLGALLASLSWAQNGSPQAFSWRYYRPGNTGIQGDWCSALRVGASGDPWIGGYDPGFEEGGIAKFIQSENRWLNVSNVDYPVIGHPDRTGTARVFDIEADSQGRMWMATGRGGLLYDPNVGPASLRRFGGDNSPIPGGMNKGVEVAPDGTVWFSSYSTSWGSGGIARYNPATNQWLVFQSYGGGPLAIQPQGGGNYFVWTMLGSEAARYSSATGAWTVLPLANGNPASLPGKNTTDSAGNVWMYKWTNASLYEYRLDLRRPDGTWANTPAAPFDVQGNGASAIRALGPNQAVFVDGGGTVYRFNGSSWENLGMWNQTTSTEDVDIDPSGNVWACGAGGAARRDAATGQWQRYRITNTSQYGSFTNDLTIDPSGGIYASANAGSGYGGMVRFDGARWIGFNNYEYGLGQPWPFPCDDSTKVYMRPSNHNLVVNPLFNGLHNYDGTSWFDYLAPTDSAQDVVEDSLGRLWMTYYGGLAIRNGAAWTLVSNAVNGKLRPDPTRPGTVWAMGDQTIIRTDGTTFFTRTVTDFPELNPQSDQFKGFAIAKDGMVWIGANTINLPNQSTLIKLDPLYGRYKSYRYANGWPFPGEYLMPLAATPDGKIWMQYDSDFLTAQRGLCWFDGKNVGVFPAPAHGEPQWGGLPHAAILDLEVKTILGGYELWMSCASRGIAVLSVTSKPRLSK